MRWLLQQPYIRAVYDIRFEAWPALLALLEIGAMRSSRHHAEFEISSALSDRLAAVWEAYVRPSESQGGCSCWSTSSGCALHATLGLRLHSARMRKSNERVARGLSSGAAGPDRASAPPEQ